MKNQQGVFVTNQDKLSKDSWDILITRTYKGKVVEEHKAKSVSKQIIQDLIKMGVFDN